MIASQSIAPKNQKYLGTKGLIIFLALLSAFVPLSTDLYLPALPAMMKFFRVDEYQTNLTLILFFVFFSAATLVWGPLSDRYGRKPILNIGLTVYMAASVLCAIASDIYQLMLFRVLQAVGAGAASAIATAIVKDVYEGKKRESVLALVQSMVVISPAVAPVIGALLLRLISWRGVFCAQAILGAAVVLGSFAFQETIAAKSGGNVAQTIGRLGVVLRNPRFTTLLVIFSMSSIAFMAFISSSTYIYQDTFRLSSQIYSYYFTFNAAGMLIGPLLYVRLSRRFNRFPIITACFSVMALSGALICAFGPLRSWVFALALLPATIAGSCNRPPSTYLMLDQLKSDTGSASSLMSSFSTVMGSVGMIVVSFNPGDPIFVVGALNVLLGLLCGGAWLFVTRRPLLGGLRRQ